MNSDGSIAIVLFVLCEMNLHSFSIFQAARHDFHSELCNNILFVLGEIKEKIRFEKKT